MKVHDIFFMVISDHVQRQDRSPAKRSFWKSGGMDAVEREEPWWQSGLLGIGHHLPVHLAQTNKSGENSTFKDGPSKTVVAETA